MESPLEPPRTPERGLGIRATVDDPAVAQHEQRANNNDDHVSPIVVDAEADAVRDHAPHDDYVSPGPCQAGPSSCFSMLQCNIRGYISHRAELEGQLRLRASLPQLVCLNETFLDDSVEDIKLGGYRLVSRRDRADGRAGGGIAVFAQDLFAEQMILLKHSPDYERSWHTVLTDIGPVLCGVWYRPPCPGEIGSIRSCDAEWRELADAHVATILIGDLNVHHRYWLRHSASVSVEGTALFRFCTSNGLRQLVKAPTREEYLLDLVISDLPANKIDILPAITDHNMVAADFSFGISQAETVSRVVFEYSKADWATIRRELAELNWRPMDNSSVDDAERFFHDNIVRILKQHIPQREVQMRKGVHPWINERCLAAIRSKNAKRGTEAFTSEAKGCCAILFEEYVHYIKRMRDKLSGLKRGCKAWWKVANQIMDKDTMASPIPALQTSTGTWVHDSASKADVLADTLSSKFVLPTIENNAFTAYWTENCSEGFVPIRASHASKILAKLDADSGTGPDGVATRVFKTCAAELGCLLAKLIRRIVSTGQWPSQWSVHWLLPLHKRNATSNPANYRAIILTPQLSKAVERLLSPLFVPTLDLRAFGEAQFAYRKQHGARDAVLLYVLSWIAGFNEGRKIGLYCSDVAGAFDRVNAELLMCKLASCGLNARLLKVLRSWLRDRSGFVIVNGEKSREMPLRNMVFQGTVWGPSLWNVFFGDCVCAIQCCGFEAVIYADDLNAWKSFARNTSNGHILEELRECQQSLHAWGRANAVTFDSGKEDTMIMSTTDACGGPAKLLGIEFDNKLVMTGAVHRAAKKAAWRTKSLLRVRRFYSIPDLVMLFKSHVLSFIEYRTPGVHFASSSVLNVLDDVQARFVRQLNLDEETAFMRFNMLPLCVRRDVSILGVIHRAVLRSGPPQLWKFFRLDLPAPHRQRRGVQRHAMQLVEWPCGNNLEIMRRSAFGMIRVYNLLPAESVQKHDLKSFQRSLTDLVRDRVTAGDHLWKALLSCRHPIFQYHPLLN